MLAADEPLGPKDAAIGHDANRHFPALSFDWPRPSHHGPVSGGTAAIQG